MMPVSLRLAIRQWLTRPLRPILCSVAIAAAVALVLTIGAGFDSLKSSLRTGIGQMLGVAEIHVRPGQKGAFARVPESVLVQLKGMKDIQMASGRIESSVMLRRADDLEGEFPLVRAEGGAAALQARVFTAGHRYTEENADSIVMDDGVARALRVSAEDNVEITVEDGKPITVTVTGVLQDLPNKGSKPAVYMPAALAEKVGKSAATVKVRNRMPDLWFDAVGSDPAFDEKLRPKRFVAGKDYATGSKDEILVDESVANKMKVGMGDVLEVSANETEPRRMKVVGIVKRPQIQFLSKPTVFLSTPALTEMIALKEPAYNVIDLKLSDSKVDLDEYAKDLQARLDPTGRKDDPKRTPLYKVVSATTRKSQFEQETQNLRVTLVVLSMISATCAALIIGTTLSVGVQERLRQFGHLRCIGASRGQLIGFLIADAVVLAMGGLVLGVGLGMGLSWALVRMYPDIFLTWEMSVWSLTLAALTGLFATLLGSLIPGWQISRITPMQAIRAVGTQVRTRHLALAAALGVGLILMHIVLWQIPSPTVRFYVYGFVGIPLVFIGYSLMGPLLLVAMEKVVATPVSWVFMVRPALLKHAWSRTPWRAGAIVAALMIGVTLFTSIRARSYGIKTSYTLPNELPDLFLASLRGGVPADRAQRFMDKEWYRKHPDEFNFSDYIETATVSTFLPVQVKQEVFNVSAITESQYTQFVCMDPDVARKMFNLDFIQGNPDEAWRRLKAGRSIFVSREFQVARGIGVGSVIKIETKTHGVVEFNVAAVVSSTAMDVAKNFFDIRSTVQDASVASVLGTTADAKEYFDLDRYAVVLANVKEGKRTAETMKLMREQFTKQGFVVATAFDMKKSITELLDRVVNALTMIAVGALALASLGVANLVIASTHARRFEFGVLRAIGAGRGQLLRMVLAEIAMIAVVATFLGSLAGLHFVYMGTLLDRLLVGFPTRFIENWQDAAVVGGIIGLSLVITVLIACVASFVPALKSSFSAQRELLATARG